MCRRLSGLPLAQASLAPVTGLANAGCVAAKFPPGGLFVGAPRLTSSTGSLSLLKTRRDNNARDFPSAARWVPRRDALDVPAGASERAATQTSGSPSSMATAETSSKPDAQSALKLQNQLR